MRRCKFIKIKGKEGNNTGYFVPRLYRLHFCLGELKCFGFRFVKERLAGWSIWWVNDENDYIQAIEALNELKKTRIFVYEEIK